MVVHPCSNFDRVMSLAVVLEWSDGLVVFVVFWVDILYVDCFCGVKILRFSFKDIVYLELDVLQLEYVYLLC